MKRKIFSAILAGVMVLCLLPTSFSSIPASADSTILISSRDDLENIIYDTDGSYRLTADIDLSGQNWAPLPAFKGTLDGGDHIIRNLSITNTTEATGDNKGLFASVSAGGHVLNLGLEGVNITANDCVGSIAGTNAGKIERCYTTGTVSGQEYAGGIAARNTGTIENCYSRVSVSGKSYLGGIAGSNSGKIENCYAASAITDSIMSNYLQFNGAASIGVFPDVCYDEGGYVNIPHNPSIYKDITAFTLEAWFQWEGVESRNTEFIIGKGGERFEIHTGGGSGINGLRFIPIQNGLPGGYYGDSWIDVHNVLQTGWFHVAAVYKYDSSKTTDNVEVQVFVNGEAQKLYQKPSERRDHVPVGEIAYLSRNTDPLSNENINFPITIGKRSGTTDNLYFNGKIADVRFWNTARTAEQIRANKDRELTGSEPGLLGYWKLREDSGPAIDSANGISGTLTDVGGGSVTRVTSDDIVDNKGALAGDNAVGTVTGCFYDAELYGPDSGGAGKAKQTRAMKTQSTYTGWDFGTVWMMESGGYPCLRFKKVTSVVVSPDTARVVKGGTHQFSATVTGENDPASTVSWTVEGGIAGTSIDANGLLTVASGETAAALTVRATSTGDTNRSGTAAVTVVETQPDVTAVTVTPAASSVAKGGTQSFSATVAGNSPAQTVNWAVENKASASTAISSAGVLSVGSDETAATLTVRATSTVDPTVSGTAKVAVTAPPPVSDAADIVPVTETVYNDPSIPNATIWLSGSGLTGSDLLVTETLTSGKSYSAMQRLANGDDVFRTYDIHLQSGKKSTGSAMHITFDLAAKYAGQSFTLVHQKDDGTYEYFYATADTNGDLTFGPLYSLSPFMLVKGTLSEHGMMNVPNTGNNPSSMPWIGILLISVAALTAGFAIKRRKSI